MEMEYRGFMLIYPEILQLGTIFPYQICLRGNDPSLTTLLRAKFGKNVPIVAEDRVLDHAIEKAKLIVDDLLDCTNSDPLALSRGIPGIR